MSAPYRPDICTCADPKVLCPACTAWRARERGAMADPVYARSVYRKRWAERHENAYRAYQREWLAANPAKAAAYNTRRKDQRRAQRAQGQAPG